MQSDFLKISKIHSLSDSSISCESALLSGQTHELLESMAQCAAYHVRHLSDCTRQAFLMKVGRYPLSESRAIGVVSMEALLVGSASSTQSYTVAAQWDGGSCNAELLIGTTDYDERFDGGRLRPYYQEIIKCLMNA